MRADIHDGQEHKRSIHGPDTEAQDQSSPSVTFGLQHTAGPYSGVKRVGSAISVCRLDSERMSATEITGASGQSATFGSLFNHLVGACEQRGRNVEAK
jgi:hypothetical protein